MVERRRFCQCVLLALAGLGIAACAADGQNPRVKVACIGDSIVSGYALANPGRDSFPSQLQRLLDEKFPGRYEVRNFGNPGRGVYTDTPAFDKKGKRAYRFYSEHAAALAWQPDIVISDLGINDIEAYAEELKGRREKGRFAREYRTLLAEYAALPSKPRILMWTKLMPLVEGHRLRTSDAPMRMRSDLESVAHAVGAQEIDMFTPFASKTNGYFHADGVHPTPLGAAVIAEELRSALLSHDGR